MKKLIIILLSATVVWSCSHNSSTPELVSAQIRDYWGYINCKGEMVIAPQFESAMPFSDGLALVETEEDGYCFLDKKGQFVKGLQGLDDASPFSEGLAVVVRPLECPEVVNTSGKVLFRLPEAETVFPFSEGLCLFTKEVKIQNPDGSMDTEYRYGFVNTRGKVVIAPTYKYASSFKDGLAAAESDSDMYGFIDNKGRWVIKPNYSEASQFSEGLAAVRDKSTHLWGYVNKKGVVKILPQFEACGPFQEGLAYVSTRSGLAGFINKKGRFVIQPQFDDDFNASSSFFGFSEGLAIGIYDFDEGRGGYINKKGTIEIPGIIGFPFNGPLTAAAVMKDIEDNPHFGIIDKKGNFVVAPVYDGIIWSLDDDLFDDLGPSLLYVRSDYEDISWLQTGGDWYDNPYQYESDTYTFDPTNKTVKKYIVEQGKTVDGTYSYKDRETMLLQFKKLPSETLELDHRDQRIKAGDRWYFAENGTAYDERMRREYKLKGGEWYYKSSSNQLIWCYPDSYYSGGVARSVTFYEFPEGTADLNDGRLPLSAATRTASFTVKDGRALHKSGNKVADIEPCWPYDNFRVSGDSWYSGEYDNQ